MSQQNVSITRDSEPKVAKYYAKTPNLKKIPAESTSTAESHWPASLMDSGMHCSSVVSLSVRYLAAKRRRRRSIVPMLLDEVESILSSIGRWIGSDDSESALGLFRRLMGRRMIMLGLSLCIWLDGMPISEIKKLSSRLSKLFSREKYFCYQARIVWGKRHPLSSLACSCLPTH